MFFLYGQEKLRTSVSRFFEALLKFLMSPVDSW